MFVLFNPNVALHTMPLPLVNHLPPISEVILPRLNAISTLSDLKITATIYLSRDRIASDVAAKLPYAAAGIASSVGMTGFGAYSHDTY